MMHSGRVRFRRSTAWLCASGKRSRCVCPPGSRRVHSLTLSALPGSVLLMLHRKEHVASVSLRSGAMAGYAELLAGTKLSNRTARLARCICPAQELAGVTKLKKVVMKLKSDDDLLKFDDVSYVVPFCRVCVCWLPSSFQLGRPGCAWKSQQTKRTKL